jgi:signal transduction histidine kinase
MTTIAWPWIRARSSAVTAAHDEGLRQVAIRLAAQTVALLLVMLIVLEIIVYLITRQTLLGSLESTLKTRAAQPDGSLCGAFHVSCGPFGPQGPPRGQGNPASSTGQGKPVSNSGNGGFPHQGAGPTQQFSSTALPHPSDASAVYVDTGLHIRHSDGALGGHLLDRQAARTTLRIHRPQCCDTKTYKGQSYLVFTDVLRFNGKVMGAVQTSISEHQYQRAMEGLLQALFLVAVLGLVGSGGISALLTRRALQPIRLAVQRQRDFVADAAHELRTPLAIMRTVGEVGLNGQNGEDQQTTIEQMLAENQHLTRLVDDLSLLARADSRAVSIERRPTDISSMIAETTAELTPLANGQGVTVTADVEENIQVLGDILRLRQLLLILLDNALKHTPSGGTISIRLSRQNARARLQVADSGPGIDPADLPQIFDRFYRADQSRTGEGSGLGLAIGKWIVDAHGGSIHADNAPDRGAVFTVTLPLARIPASG